MIDIEERYSTLQEEAAGKTKKLKKVFGMLMSAKAELSDLQYEQQREMEGLLDSIRSLTRELKLQETIIDAFIPHQYQASHNLSLLFTFILHRVHMLSSTLPVCFYCPPLWTSTQFFSSSIPHYFHFDFLPALSSLRDSFQYLVKLSCFGSPPRSVHLL